MNHFDPYIQYAEELDNELWLIELVRAKSNALHNRSLLTPKLHVLVEEGTKYIQDKKEFSMYMETVMPKKAH